MSQDLRPYVPRLVLEWAAETPDARYRSIDGTLVFCDVSGFTALSERLARLGKLGAEELNAALNGIFGALLDRAAAFGGSMLKYGGDAILVFFWGDAHARRGAAAAVAMRTELRRAGNVRTAGGRVRLRMSVGAHTGRFDFFLVGESHRELVVAGPAATRTCDLEATADAGEILISAETAAQLPPSCLGGARGDGILLARAPTAPHGIDTDEPLSDAAPFVPLALREHLSAGGHEPEHRLVTNAFVAFGGVDDALATRGAEKVADGLHRFISSAQRHFDTNGVAFLTTDIYGGGGKIFAAAGAPRTWDNNEERMLLSLRALLDEDHDFELHAGVQRGYAFAGDVGPQFRRTYTLLGDVINTAARVMASAGHGQLRVMRPVLDRSATAFDSKEQDPFAAKGKKEPLITYALGAPTGTRGSEDVALPLVGRDDLVARLVARAADTGTGAGWAVLLSGPEGIGKTRVVDEVLAPLGTRVITASGSRYASASAYFALRGWLAGALGLREPVRVPDLAHAIQQIAPDQRPWLPLVGVVFGLEMPATPETSALAEHATAARLRTTVVRLLQTAITEATALRVENVQWLDEASRLLLNEIAAAASTQPWFVIATTRDATLGPADIEPVELGPLDHADSLALLRAAAPGRFLPSEAATLVERSGGNPLFLRELAAASTVDDTLPETLEALIASRIDGLDPSDRARLRAAAVIGAVVEPGLLRELTGDAVSLRSGLEGFLEPAGDRLRFRQAVFQHAAYAGLSYRRRRALHAAAGRAIEGSTKPPEAAAELLSLHFHEAQDFERSWRYSLVAGRRAEAAHAPSEAAAFYRRGLEASRRLSLARDELAQVWERCALQLSIAGKHDAVPDALREARRLTTEGARQAFLCMREGQARQNLGNPAAARRWYRRGLKHAASSSDAEARAAETRLLTTLAEVSLRQGRVGESNHLAAQALEIALRTQDGAGAAHAHTTLGVAAMVRGDLATAQASFQAALPLYREVGDRAGEAQVLSNLGSAAQATGHWPEAVDAFSRAAAALNEIGEVVAAAVSQYNAGEVLLDQGRFADAGGELEGALDVFVAAGSWYAAYPERRLAEVAATSGEYERAGQLLQRARERFMELHVDDEVAQCDLQRVSLLLLGDNRADALAALENIDSSGAPGSGPRHTLLRAALGVDVGDDALQATLVSAEALGDFVAVVLAAQLLGRDVADVRARLGLVALPRWAADLTRSPGV